MDEKALLEAIGQIMDSKLAAVLEPIKADVTEMKEDIARIKENTAVTRETTNMIGEWVEVSADVLKIQYPVK